jgi:leucyl aminopeptidase
MLALKSGDLHKINILTWVVPVCEDADIHEDKAIVSLIQRLKPFKEFKGQKEDELVLYDPGDVTARRIIFIGLGKLEKLNAESFRTMAGRAVKKCIPCGIEEMMLIVPPEEKTLIGTEALLEAAMEGAFLANHIFDTYKNEKKHVLLKQVHFYIGSAKSRPYDRLVSRVETICQWTLAAREWVSMPSNEKHPEVFAEFIRSHPAGKKLKITVMDEKALKKGKFGGILAVAAGSASKPRMILMEHRTPGAKKTIVLVGKGVTFDSGGINLKLSGSIEDMKMDMAGAAAVAATLFAAAQLSPSANVIGVIPLAENLPSGDASRPGDIIRAYNGKTVEIGNTDAEGRLILADALAYAVKKFKPDVLIDVATLTGACAVALGEKIAGLFTFDDELAKTIASSAQKTSERCWRLPMPEDYKELLKSDFADIHNMSSSRFGGAIAGALFLSEFVGNAKWAHLDIAGPAYVKKPADYCSIGGTGFGVRLFCDLLEKL